jgi:hypothetical protein
VAYEKVETYLLSYKLSLCVIKLRFVEPCFVLDTADAKTWEIYYFNNFLKCLKMQFLRITVT